MDHSVRGYLSRRTISELQDCLAKAKEGGYEREIPLIQEILQQRLAEAGDPTLSKEEE